MMEIYDKLGGVLTDPNYWDCECDVDYIHHISDVEPCEKCGADPEEQCNSRPNEIAKAFTPFERAEHEEIAKGVTKLRRYQLMVTFDRFVDVVADTEQESKRIAQARIDELVRDLSATHVSAWDMAVGDMFYSTEGTIDETETDDEEAAWDWALRSKDYPKETEDREMNREEFWKWMKTCPTDEWECVEIEGDYCRVVFPLDPHEEEE